MRIYMAGGFYLDKELVALEAPVLLSYVYRARLRISRIERYSSAMKHNISLFLDSGAYSAWSQKTEIDIKEYIEFIKRHEKSIKLYANLDAIGDPEKTLNNQKIMEDAGLKPLPCFHIGEDIKYLKYYLKHYDYLAFGGMVPYAKTPDILSRWLDTMFGDYICDASGKPQYKVHGFGLTSLPLMLRFPWWSVDSTSWVMTSRLGSIYVPRVIGGKYSYDTNPLKVSVSAQSPDAKEAGQHISTFSDAERKLIKAYIHDKGFCIGESEYRWEYADYALEEDEQFADKEVINGERLVHKFITRGVSNDYRMRDQINIKYFMDLEKSITPYDQIRFKRSTLKGFFK